MDEMRIGGYGMGERPTFERGKGVSGKDGGFDDVLKKYLEEVDRMQHEADGLVTDLATGKLESPHQLVIALAEAEMSFRLMMEMRNKLVAAYQEIMRMQV